MILERTMNMEMFEDHCLFLFSSVDESSHASPHSFLAHENKKQVL